MVERVVLWILIFVPLFIALTMLLAYLTMLLWNWLMPDIFGLTQIDFWQALGLLVLSTLLFWRSK